MSLETTRKSFTPGEVWPDDQGIHINAHGGGLLCHEGMHYWFGEHKLSGPKGNLAEVGVHVYASRDLYTWKDEGIALQVSLETGHDLEKGCVIERPKVIYNRKTRTFVMWFHLELKGKGYDAARTGLAVSDKVTGPYQFIRSVRPNAGVWPVGATEELKHPVASTSELAEREAVVAGKYLRRDFPGGQMSRDMTLFVDDDEKAYLLTASENNQTLHLHELTDDYRDFTGKWTRVFPGDSNEAPAIFKKDGKYYMISSDCTGWKPNPARSGVADSIWGPWTALGNPCRGTEKDIATTFESQSTFVLPVPGRPGEFVYLGDRWRPDNALDGRYIWLPIEWEEGKPVLRWYDNWDLSRFWG